jgi:hypothetical protein
VAAAALGGFVNFARCFSSFAPNFLYRKDMIQEYLMARALWAGMDPYLPCPELAMRFLGSLPTNIVNHPTPHPPPLALLSLPLGLMPYKTAALVWFFLEICCLFAISWMALKWLTGRKGSTLLWQSVLMMMALLTWTPLYLELYFGQVMILLLSLIILSWQLFIRKKDLAGGLLLGGAVAIKIIAWPIILFMALKRNVRATCAALAVVVFLNLVAGLVMGFNCLAYYYLQVGPLVSKLHNNSVDNFSLWTVAARLFLGTGNQIILGIEAPPLYASLHLAKSTITVLPIMAFIFGMVWAYLAMDREIAIGILICMTILISPVAWSHYLILCLIPLIIVLERLDQMNWPIKDSALLLGVVQILLIAPDPLRSLIYFATQKSHSNQIPQLPFTVSFGAGMLTLLPVAGIFLLMVLLNRQDRLKNQMF